MHHCSRTVGIRKIYHHYNFTVEMKNDKDCWIPRVYFAEVKMKYGFKYRFCAPLEATDDGMCSYLFLLIQTLWFKQQCRHLCYVVIKKHI